MGLSNKQFDSILEEYDSIRLQNHYTQLKRQDEVRKKVPAYYEHEDQLRSIRMKMIKANVDDDTETLSLLTEQERLLKDNRDRILEEAGFEPDYLLPIYNCSKCKDTGFLPETRQKCSCFIKAQTRLLFEQSGIYNLIRQQNFDTLSFDYFNEKEGERYANALNISRHFIESFDSDYQNLVFYGNVGTGKTFLSCCIAKALMEEGNSVIYCSADKLFKNLAELRQFSENKSSYISFMEDVNQCDLLIIDDLGTETTTEWVKSDLFTCLNNRDLFQRATLISTNLPLKELQERYSERIFSRLSSNFTFCKFEGRDIRVLKKEQENRK